MIPLMTPTKAQENAQAYRPTNYIVCLIRAYNDTHINYEYACVFSLAKFEMEENELKPMVFMEVHHGQRKTEGEISAIHSC
jgi:hypothetical protein